MRTRAVIRRSLVVAGLSTWMAMCGDPKTTNPASPSGSAVNSAELIGPGSLAPGQSAQFSVAVHLADGTTKTAATATWRTCVTSSFPCNPFLIKVTSAGLVTAGSGIGDVTLSADVAFRGTTRVTRELVILPDGTYRLVGKVTDGEFPSMPVASAHLTATPGSATTTTDSQGNYRLYGVPPDGSLQISHDGYQPLVQSLHLTAHASQSFQLTPTAPRINLAGLYTLTIDAAPGCAGPGSLPADLQHRSYQATVTQNGLAIQVALTESRFRINPSGLGNHFAGLAGVGGATFTLDNYSDYYYFYYRQYPSIAERLPDGTILVVVGPVVTTGTPTGLTGTFDGFIAHYDSRFPTTGYIAGCFSSSHQFALTPR
jgi:hypothetical protein